MTPVFLGFGGTSEIFTKSNAFLVDFIRLGCS
jgi:hypothetical protein